jgi:protein-L-isoaspartate(D-aspartate) O-methyltransferase
MDVRDTRRIGTGLHETRGPLNAGSLDKGMHGNGMICQLAVLSFGLLVPLGASAAGESTDAALDAARASMVEREVKGAGVSDPRVLKAMLATPRHEFLDSRFRDKAYLDMALPIGAHQTISSPFIVAFMTQCIDPQPEDKVLEIGTGSGYQAAVLSPLVKEVYTIEIEEQLGKAAQLVFQRLHYENVHSKIGDGFAGWPEHAPFDKIIVTCSPEKPPQPLLDQLKEGGLMVIPVGERFQQTLYVFRKEAGRLTSKAMQPTLFVPMTGQAEKQREVQPDPLNPQLRNGDFETPPGGDNQIPGWYYQRACTWEPRTGGRQGGHCAVFRSDEPGRASNLLQGFGIDGRRIGEIEVTAQVKCDHVFVHNKLDFPAVAVSFYDENRKDIGVNWIGPFQGTAGWKTVKKKFRVPPDAREAIMRIGLFRATGEVSFDDVRITGIRREGRGAAAEKADN